MNHKLFVQFLVSATTGCFYAALSMGLPAYEIMNGKIVTNMSNAEIQHLVMASVLAASLTIAISILMFTHIYFVFSSMCSVEAGSLTGFNPFF